MRQEKDLIHDIEEDFKHLKEKVGSSYIANLTKGWEKKCLNHSSMIVNSDLSINVEALRHFRRDFVFVSDVPSFRGGTVNPLNFIGGGRRGDILLLKDTLAILKARGYDGLLKKIPCSPVGDPNVFEYDGYRFTHRWARHIYGASLFDKILSGKLKDNFTCLDLGSSYGIFSCILKHMRPKACLALMDFPEQLLLAHYFLGMNFPQARIAAFKDVDSAGTIDRKWLEQYDFALIPITHYRKIAPYTLDVLSNFASLSEMMREWFDTYMKNEPFKSTKYFYTYNRFHSAPEHEGNITILDYPLDEFKTLHFEINPMFGLYYKKKYVFFTEKSYLSSQFFEFIGERK